MKSQKGVAHLVLLLLVLVGIALGAWLIGKQTNIIPHADEATIKIEAPQYISNQILVKFKDALPSPLIKSYSNHQIDSQNAGDTTRGVSDFDTFAQKNQLVSVEQVFSTGQPRINTDGLVQTEAASELNRWYTLTLPGDSTVITPDSAEYATLNNTISDLRKLPDIEIAQPNLVLKTSFIPNDPRYNEQTYIPQISAQNAWDINRGSPNVKVAVLDSGIDQNHPDLIGKVVSQVDLTDIPRVNNHEESHGTSVAGLIGAIMDNSEGIAGVSPNVSLMDYRVAAKNQASTIDVTRAIVLAADNGASVINMSLGGPGGCFDMYQDAINYAWARNVAIVAAAGNNQVRGPNVPSNCKHVISVGAVDKTDEKAFFSNYGKNADGEVLIAAPGSPVLSTTTKNEIDKDYYAFVGGTSFASPIVAATIALVRSVNPSLTNDADVAIVESTADKIAHTGDYWKYGRVNVQAAVNKAAHLDSPIFLTAEADCKKNQPVIYLNFNDIAPGGTTDPSVQYTIQMEPNAFKNTIIPGKLSLRPLVIDNLTANLTPKAAYELSIKTTNNTTSNKVSLTLPDCTPIAPSPSPIIGNPPFLPKQAAEGSQISISVPEAGEVNPNDNVPVYDLSYTTNGNIHFYTANRNEADKLTREGNWTYQGVAWYAYKTQVEGTVPVNHFYQETSDLSTHPGLHYFTMDSSIGGWVNSGIAWYAYSTQKEGTVPVYNLYRTDQHNGWDNGGLHYFTTSTAQKDGLLKARDPQGNPYWLLSDEPTWYVYPSNTGSNHSTDH